MIATFLAIAYLSKDTKKSLSRNEEGKYVLRLNRAHQIGGLICVAIALGALAIGVLGEEEYLFLMCSPFLLSFGCIGWYSIASYFNHEVVFDENLIAITDWKGVTETISWEQIEKISFSRNWGYLYLYIIGLVTFVQMMEQRTKWRAKDIGLHF